MARTTETKYTLETAYRIHNDNTGERIEVCPDADGLDHIEIRFIDDTGKIGTRLCGPPEQMHLVAQAILKLTETTPVPEKV